MGNVIVSSITRTPVDQGGGVWGGLGAGVTPPPSGDVVYPLTYADRTKTVTVGATGAGDGSIGSPWTLAQAMTTAVAGDVVGIEAGTYIGVPTFPASGSRYKPVFEPANSGTALNPIVFIAENLAYNNTTGLSDIRTGVFSIADGNTGDPVSALFQPVMGGNNKDYIHWVGLFSDASNTNNRVRADCGNITHWNSVGCIVANCKLLGAEAAYYTVQNVGSSPDNNFSGVRAEDTSGIEIYGNHFEQFSLSDTAGSGGNMSAVLTYKSALLDIHHNTSYTCGNAWQPKGSVGTYDNEACKFYNNFVDNCSHMVRAHALHQLTNLIHNNIHSNANGPLFSTNTSGGAIQQNDIRLFNNTLSPKDQNMTSGVLGLQFLSVDWQNAVGAVDTINNAMFNNILYEPRFHLSSTEFTGNDITTWTNFADYDYNCVYGATFGVSIPPATTLTFANWQATSGEDANSTTTDPLFVSATDFHLQAGSPALTGGNDIYNFYGGGAGSTIPQGAYVTGTEQIGNGVTI